MIWPSRAEAARAAAARSVAGQPVTRSGSGFWAWFTQPVEPSTRGTTVKAPDARPADPKRARDSRAKPAATSPRSPLTPRLQPALREAIVYLQTVPEKVEAGLVQRSRRERVRPNVRIVQADARFSPRVTAVPAGSTVEFQNLDRVWHNAFSVSRANRFDLGKYPPGRIDTVRFDRAGLVNLHCDIHPDESAFVLVVPNHAYVRPDSLGQFTLPKMPPGTYTLRLWHPRLGEASRTIEMPKRGDLDVDMAF